MLDAMEPLWNVQRGRVEQYANEAALEQGFIQPVFERLGWKLLYQAFLQGSRPDYALFLDDESLNAALQTDHRAAEFWQRPAIVAHPSSLAEREHIVDDIFYFYLFFSHTALRAVEARTPLIARAVRGSSEYRLGVGESLKERVYEALRLV